MEALLMTDTHPHRYRRLLPRRERPHRSATRRRSWHTRERVGARTWPMCEASFDRDDLELRLFGAVKQSLRLDWAHLTALPKISLDIDLDCRSVDRPRRIWAGASLQQLLSQADLEPKAIRATIYSAGGYFTRFGVGELVREGGLLAYEVDGRPLTRSEGGPVRLVLPYLEPWRCAKWVQGISIEDDVAL